MYVDAVPSREAEKLSERCERLPWDRVRLNESLEALREIRIRTEKGRPAEGLICAIREDGKNRNVFIVHAKKAVHGRVETPEKYFLSLKGLWTAEKWDTMTGEITPLAVSYTEETTEIEWRCWGQDNLLMRLAPAKAVSREESSSQGRRSAPPGSPSSRARSVCNQTLRWSSPAPRRRGLFPRSAAGLRSGCSDTPPAGYLHPLSSRQYIFCFEQHNLPPKNASPCRFS